MFRSLRTFSILRRHIHIPARSLLRQDGQMRIQRVRIVQPFFTRRRMQKALLALGGFTLVGYVASSLVEDEEDDQEVTYQGEKPTAGSKGLIGPAREDLNPLASSQDFQNSRRNFDGQVSVSDDNAKDDDEDTDEDDDLIPDEMPEDALFIPLGFINQLPTTYYKGTDPEWQSFIAFMRDKQKDLQVRNQLAGLVGHIIGEFPPLQKALGSPMMPRRFWLEIDIPSGPPPEYVRSGLEITDDYVAWTTRPVSATQYNRLRMIFQPFAALSAFWASYKVLLSLQLARMRQVLDFKPNHGDSSLSVSQNIFNPQHTKNNENLMEKNRSKSEPEDLQSLDPNSDNELEAEGLPGAAKNRTSLDPNQSDTGVSRDMKIAFKTFEKTFAKNWKPPGAVVERGCLLVSGLVEVEGPKAVCIIDVLASYHPEKSHWVSVSLRLRRLQPKRLRPKGGI